MFGERTLAIIKPDAFDYRDEIVAHIMRFPFKILREREHSMTHEEATLFYREQACMPFFSPLCKFMSSGPIYVMALEGENGIYRWRNLIGDTNPQRANIGTLRKQYGTAIPRNALHGSANLADAVREIKFFFNPW